MARSSVPTSSTQTPKTEGTAASAPDLDTVKSDAGAVAQEAESLASQVASEVTSTATQIADEAKAQFAEQAGKIKGMAGEQKELFAQQIGGVAEAMEKVAGELEASNGANAHYARMIADNAGKISSTIRDNDVDALFNMAQDFGRRQPAAFIGAAALLGFAASRFLMASANRPAAGTSTGMESELGEDGPSYAGASSSAGTEPYQDGRV